MTIMIYVILFFVYSHLGWLIEVIDTLIIDHKFTNRGFLIGPYCPIYGFGSLLFVFLLKADTNDFIGLFLKAVIICSILEYSTSYIMEKIFKMRWWDYSNRKFNINGRICLETMIPFGILGSIVMYLINPMLIYILQNINSYVINITAYIIIIIMLLDFIISFKIILNIKGVIKNVAKDSTDEITKIVRNTFNKSKLYKRISKAFPKIKVSDLFKLKK